jgi:hypothetical protein
MKYLKTYEGLFDFLKKKYKQTTNILDELAFGEDSEDSEESEEPDEDSPESKESRESKEKKPQPKIDYNLAVTNSLVRLESNVAYFDSKYKIAVKDCQVSPGVWEFEVNQVEDGLVANFRLELGDRWTLEVNYPDLDIKKKASFAKERIFLEYNIRDLIESCKSDIFKKEFPLEDIKDYFSDLGDLVDVEIKYDFSYDKVVYWSVKVCVDKKPPRGVRRDMEKLIKSQSLDLEVLKELKNINFRLSGLGLVADFEKDTLRLDNYLWNGYLVKVMKKSDLGIYSNATDEEDEDYDEDYDEDDYDD